MQKNIGRTHFKKGFTPWNKGKKTGIMPWLGKKRSKETKRKMSESMKGSIPWNKGKKTGITPWLGKKRPDISGDKCHLWKGGQTKGERDLQKRRNAELKRNAEGTYTIGEWETLKAQYGLTCPLCKKSEPEIKLTIDHIIPLSRGGSNWIENVQPLCMPCNARKHTKVIKY